MESNNKIANRMDIINNPYKDPTPVKVLTKKDLNGMVWRSLLLQSSFNYERMQGGGWTYNLIPGLKKIHKNEQDLSAALLDHMQFFNTHPFLVPFIQGIILAMEEAKEKRETIRGVKVALMGPLGGIGDALIFFTLLPISAGIGASFALEGNILGPILFLLIFNIAHFAIRFGLMHRGYSAGTKAIASFKESTKKLSRAASIVGLTVIGALVATYINFKLGLNLNVGSMTLDIQAQALDQIMPKLLPLLYTIFCFLQLKRGRSPIALIGITVLLGLVGCLIGLF